MKYTVYKVVRWRLDRGYISAAVEEPAAQLEYSLGNTTKALPNSLGVFVFEDLEKAKDWAQMWIGRVGAKIFECHTEDKPQRPARIASYKDVVETLALFKKCSWARRLKWTIKKFHNNPPAGTRVVRSVTPIRIATSV